MRYRTLDVLCDVAFQVHRGEVLALLGPNGAGKLAGRIIILAGGRIVAQGTAAELRDQIAGEDEVRWILKTARAACVMRFPLFQRSCR